MRTSLIVFGVVFLVIGLLLYFIPMQQISADTTTTGNGNTDTRTSSASLNVPVEWAFGSVIIGFVLLILGLAIPNPTIRNTVVRGDTRKDSYVKTVESKENIDDGDGKRHRVVKEHTEKYEARNDLGDLN